MRTPQSFFAARVFIQSHFREGDEEDTVPDKDNNKNIPCQQTDDRGRMVVENGRLYFALGKNMILVSEHFNQNGKDIETLLESAIRHAAVDTTEALKNSA